MSEKPAKNWTAQEIRQAFLDFFKSVGHKVVPSAPIVIKGDPTLMFTNAGMNQFKDYFLGNSTPVDSRLTDTQKCLRVSGKHNDLEEVGHDTYHHTMFEMLGNWSFGDYFKKDAIDWAWQLLTDVYGLPEDRLYVTVFEGDDHDGQPRDQEAYDQWAKWVNESRILNGDRKDNFWEMGATGPCGPSSEIHMDLRSDDERKRVDGATLVNQDHPQVVEIWNLVFIEYNRKADGSLDQLPQKHVDTGMGFERLCMALQGVQSNYDTDVFRPLIQRIEDLTDSKYGEMESTDIAIRVIADHVRAVAFAIADGQLPSNTGAGYVIRRILRRAIRYAFSYLEQKNPFIYQLVDVLSDQMGAFFPEIKEQHDLVANVIREEEQGFLRTLEQGLSRIDQMIKESTGKEVRGAQVFELHDTFGFPPDLTALILKERGFHFEQSEYDEEMKAQKDRARSASRIDTDDWVVLQQDNHEEFVGYDRLDADVRITRYRKVVVGKKEQFQLVFNLTPFYPEGGGQVGDKGVIKNDDEEIAIYDTKKEHGVIMHFASKLPKNPGAGFKAVVSDELRQKAALNHSATHLLHQALREVLGEHVQQKGSLVHPDHLRFDFSHFARLSEEE
jgi:alanyl-tRNA synthetase